MATHSSVLAWRIPWTEEPGYRPWGCKESDTTKWLTLPLEEIWKLSHTPKGFGTQGSPTSRPLCIIILQAWFCRLLLLSRVQLFAVPWTYSLPGSSLHGILQARILEWIAVPFSRGSFWPRDWTWVSCIAGRFFTIWATRGCLLQAGHWAHTFCPRGVCRLHQKAICAVCSTVGESVGLVQTWCVVDRVPRARGAVSPRACTLSSLASPWSSGHHRACPSFRPGTNGDRCLLHSIRL